jgi:hypothetical protein
MKTTDLGTVRSLHLISLQISITDRYPHKIIIINLKILLISSIAIQFSIKEEIIRN